MWCLRRNRRELDLARSCQDQTMPAKSSRLSSPAREPHNPPLVTYLDRHGDGHPGDVPATVRGGRQRRLYWSIQRDVVS